MEYLELNEQERDVLKEIGNIGAGNAATALSKLLNAPIQMDIPTVTVAEFDGIMNEIGGAEETIVGLMFQVFGDITGTVYLILSVEEAEFLVRTLVDDPTFEIFGDGPTSDMGISALQEIGNIVTGSYLTALSDLTKLDMQPSVPYLGVDMAGAVLTVGLVELANITDYALMIDTEITHKEKLRGVKGKFFLIPDPASLDRLFNSLGVRTNE